MRLKVFELLSFLDWNLRCIQWWNKMVKITKKQKGSIKIVSGL